MKYTKLNKNWNVAQSETEPEISVEEIGLGFRFHLNHLQFPHIDEGDKGILKFQEVYAYNLEPINQEEYEQGKFRFKNEELPWGKFYELPNSSWRKDFSADKVVVNNSLKATKLKHFIFFLPNHIFECIAGEYRFQFECVAAEKLEERYPKGYFNHYLALFAVHFDQLNIGSYKVYTNLYIQLEGKKEFELLKEEIKTIKANKDVDAYVKIANYSELPNFGRKQLDEMIKVIETYDTGSKYA
ncbi:hypothetical protein [Fluviicola taffensis]|uniref:Uncharacterized protein n=1 Tax=Fluviicola taffensis (strain DSM 16823 / NCIMB 13979 / RW262) TaxID=755732 RepID=F2IGC1_FLUTR|nr:hypothetical protein [Fluviicola taffensis]AEA45787.1 hypothetical protein Fluta_3821 [Fluviicola taffensis DSM 16823]